VRTIKEILVNRDGMTNEEADDLLDEALEDLRARFDEGVSVEDFCEEWFGLEPDYMEELMDQL
jgi:hypothetical protein